MAKNAQHVIILGAGITGVLSAYYLGKAGYKVEVIDRQPSPARECSYSNGGQLSYSHAEPWANPYVFKKLAKWIWRSDAPLVLRRLDYDMVKWGLRFLWNCRQSATDQNSKTMLRLGLHSKAKMKEIVDETGVEFHHNDKGILHVFSQEKEFEHAQKQAEFQAAHGCAERVLSWKECVEVEPSLEHATKKIYGGIQAPIDETGDIHGFTNELAEFCRKEFGTIFHFDTEILELNAENNQITHVSTNRGNMRADAFVMAMGAYSPIFLRPIGVNAPIYPMKGYSVRFPANEFTPLSSVTDDELKIVFTRIGDSIRVAGTAEFAGYNTNVRDVRMNPIIKGIQTMFPKADHDFSHHWACLRPSTPDGPPIIGATKYDNLYLNTGNGTLGWTQGAACANVLASIMTGQEPEIALEGLTADRFQ